MCIVDAYSTSACFWHSSKYVITHHSIVSSTTAWDISLKTPQFSLSLYTQLKFSIIIDQNSIPSLNPLKK